MHNMFHLENVFKNCIKYNSLDSFNVKLQSHKAYNYYNTKKQL